MQSGYSLDLKEGRPPISIYPEGFFIEDYSHNEVSDDTVLDTVSYTHLRAHET